MRAERWFISYRYVERDFLTQVPITIEDKAVITDVTPARWVLYLTLRMGVEHHIQYAEKISMALASELVHGGAGVPTEYFDDYELGADDD